MGITARWANELISNTETLGNEVYRALCDANIKTKYFKMLKQGETAQVIREGKRVFIKAGEHQIEVIPENAPEIQNILDQAKKQAQNEAENTKNEQEQAAIQAQYIKELEQKINIPTTNVAFEAACETNFKQLQGFFHGVQTLVENVENTGNRAVRALLEAHFSRFETYFIEETKKYRGED